ncbi:MAG: electron transfer flavoprotein subunit alpha/FixB family protein [Anaerolineales bacterium]
MIEPLYGKDEQNECIWVYLEHDSTDLAGVSAELLAKGCQLSKASGWPVSGLLVGGEGLEKLAQQAIQRGADQVWLCQDPQLETFNLEAYTSAVYQAVAKGKPSILLLGATHDGRDVAGRLAVRLQTGLNADCTDLKLDLERGVLVSDVTGFGGGIIAMLECPDRRPQMSTVRPGVFPVGPVEKSRQGEIVQVSIKLKKAEFKSQLLEAVHAQGVDISGAEMLVCGGRGIEGDFNSMHKLAELLGGEVGATRPPVDDGYIERARQVGQTGVVCRPKVALCFGISGAFHFIVGVQEADLVIAVNSDPEAPIFDYVDYGIVADVKEIVPALMKALEGRREVAHA